MTRDVEKRWSDPQTFRRAALYDGATIVLALIAMVVTIVVGSGAGDCAPDEGRLCTDTARIVVVVVPSALLLLGGSERSCRPIVCGAAPGHGRSGRRRDGSCSS